VLSLNRLTMQIPTYSLSITKAALVVVCVAGSNSTARAQVPWSENPTLQQGDHVRVTILGEDKDLSGEFEVAPDSSLKHPLYSQIKVVGVPLPVVKARFATFLRRFQKDPQFEIEPLFKVAIGGEVKTPNIYFLAPETTVGEALTHANGPTDRGDADRVIVIRDGRQISLDLTALPSTRNQLTVRSGDQINVSHRRDIASGMSSFAPLIGVAASLLSVTFIILSHHR
jgi:protein involved in polysaccharide export with SLBB domain